MQAGFWGSAVELSGLCESTGKGCAFALAAMIQALADQKRRMWSQYCGARWIAIHSAHEVCALRLGAVGIAQ